jgi:hypothetical protein
MPTDSVLDMSAVSLDYWPLVPSEEWQFKDKGSLSEAHVCRLLLTPFLRIREVSHTDEFVIPYSSSWNLLECCNTGERDEVQFAWVLQ